ncbi:MAG: hypothetical protein KDB46_12290, partial [Solirubrobacterales bacterium]|nr:hypothetical protein [Solirubrobacterales bacterium]
IDYLTKFILNASNSLNGFDQFGHFLLAQLQINNCVEYVTAPVTGCDTRWFDDRTTQAAPTKAPEADPVDPALGLDLPDPSEPSAPLAPGDSSSANGTDAGGESGGDATTAQSGKGTKDLLNFLIGSGG